MTRCLTGDKDRPARSEKQRRDGWKEERGPTSRILRYLSIKRARKGSECPRKMKSRCFWESRGAFFVQTDWLAAAASLVSKQCWIAMYRRGTEEKNDERGKKKSDRSRKTVSFAFLYEHYWFIKYGGILFQHFSNSWGVTTFQTCSVCFTSIIRQQSEYFHLFVPVRYTWLTSFRPDLLFKRFCACTDDFFR